MVITKDLGAVSAYAYAVEQGYQGTEEEFAELMARQATVAEEAAASADAAAESASEAQASAEQAEQSAQSISGDVERAEQAATTATGKATEAASSASTASGKANEASASATASAQSASSAASSAQNAASSEQLAESHATDAEQAKTDAQDAQAAAETAQVTAEAAAQSVSESAAQIAKNTGNIDALDERINILTGDNLYTGAETWSGTWINGRLWTTSQETYKGMPVKQRTGSWSGIHHAVNVEAGKHYHFTAYYKCTSAVGIQLALTQDASTASVYMWDEKGYTPTQNTTISGTFNRAGKWRKINLEFDCTASGTIHPVIQAIASTTLSVCGYVVAEGYNEEKPVYNCLKDGSGDFDALAEAVRFACLFFDATVYVGPGEWDVISELGSTYMESVSSSKRGLYIKNRIHLVFSSNSKVVANYAGSRTDTMLWFAPFNSARYGFSLENVNIECSNVRYAVHDERNAEDDEYTNYYLNCKMKLDNTNNTGTTAHQCIGGGLGLNGHIVIDGGDYLSIFPSHKPSSGYRPISYHNSTGAGKSRIDIKNVYIHDGGIRLNWYGQSTEITECYVTGCSFTSAILSSAETEDAPNQNISVTSWNNELRT